MVALNSLNGCFGRGTVWVAVSGVEWHWTAKAEYLSPRYTMWLDEIAGVRA
jgi:hypothetical protein